MELSYVNPQSRVQNYWFKCAEEDLQTTSTTRASGLGVQVHERYPKANPVVAPSSLCEWPNANLFEDHPQDIRDSQVWNRIKRIRHKYKSNHHHSMYFSFRDNEIFVNSLWYVILAQCHFDVTLPLPWPVLYALPATCFVFALLLLGLVLFWFRSIKWSERHVKICFSLSSSGQILSALFSSVWQALPRYCGWCFSEKSRPCPGDW